MIPGMFHQPWKDIDPSLQHGGIPGELEGQFVGPRLGDNPKTSNYDAYRVFRLLNDFAAAMSMRPDANVEGPPVRNAVEEFLRGVNLIVEQVYDRTQGDASRVFMWEHATPPNELLRVRPVRFPLRNEFAQEVVHYLLGCQVEIAEMNVNGFHATFDPSSSARILAPLVHLKSNIIKLWFDQEIQGEISAEEIALMMTDKSHPGPVVVPSDASAGLATDAEVTEAMAGVPVLQWFPDAPAWVKFGEKRSAMLKFERIWQPEGASPTTEDVAPESPAAPALAGANLG